jgi:small subunit ribosomal protein S17
MAEDTAPGPSTESAAGTASAATPADTEGTASADTEGTASAATPADTAATGGATAEEASRANRRKIREGLVVSNAMEKTAVVAVIERVRHPRYAKTVQRTKRLYAHDENNELRVGDRVRLAETRPQSKLKRWRVVQILERAK